MASSKGLQGIQPSKVSPSYLHSNSTSHTWTFSAIAELIDNAYDPDVNAKELCIDRRVIKQTVCLMLTDNGSGMSPSNLHYMLSFGYSDKTAIGNHQPIGRYGNGFKSGSMKLGKDAIVFTRQSNSMSVGMLSQTYLENIKSDTVLVPVVSWDLPNSQLKKKERNISNNLKAITQHSLFKSEKELLDEFAAMDNRKGTGTKIIIYNLTKLQDGNFELDFVSDPTDIRNPESHMRDFSTEDRPGREHIQDYRGSLREYCSILYLKPRMNIYVRGKKVNTKLVKKSLSQTKQHIYKPHWNNKQIPIIFGFTTSKNTDDYGMMFYHKNRLIKAYEKIGCQKATKQLGVGVVGIVDAYFLTPTHNKQDFDKDQKYNGFNTTVALKLKDYLNEINGETGEDNPSSAAGGQTRTPDWNWVQCDNCQKWRKLPAGMDDTSNLPEKWFCYLNPDAQFNRCEIEAEQSDDEELISSKQTPKKKGVSKKRQVEEEQIEQNSERVASSVPSAVPSEVPSAVPSTCTPGRMKNTLPGPTVSKMSRMSSGGSERETQPMSPNTHFLVTPTTILSKENPIIDLTHSDNATLRSEGKNCKSVTSKNLNTNCSMKKQTIQNPDSATRMETEICPGRSSAKHKVPQHVVYFPDRAASLKEKIVSEGKMCSKPNDLNTALATEILLDDDVGKRLKDNCAAFGLEFRGITPGNGNCFFAAISSQLDRLGLPKKSPEQLRAFVTNYIRNNRSYQGFDQPVSLGDFVEGDFENYCDNMSRNGTWADHVVVYGMANFLKNDILIITSSPNSEPDNSLTWVVGDSSSTKEPLLLGHYWETHYQSLQPKAIEDSFMSLSEDISEKTEPRNCTQSWKKGRRIVELSVLAKHLDSCNRCNLPLRLSACERETRQGLGTILHIKCDNPYCREVNIVPCGERHDATDGQPNKIWNINSKLANEMDRSGVGESAINHIFGMLNIPAIGQTPIEEVKRLIRSDKNIESPVGNNWQRGDTMKSYSSFPGRSKSIGRTSGESLSFHEMSKKMTKQILDRKHWSASSEVIKSTTCRTTNKSKEEAFLKRPTAGKPLGKFLIKEQSSRQRNVIVQESTTHDTSTDLNTTLIKDIIPPTPTSMSDAELRGWPFVVFDVETTGLGIKGSITQIAGMSESKEQFNQFIIPEGGHIPASLSRLTHIELYNGKMYHQGKPVFSACEKEGITKFLNWIKGKVILVAHNAQFDARMLIKACEDHGLMEILNAKVAAFSDTMPVFKELYPNRSLYKQFSLVSDILGKSYDVHNALADVTALYDLINHPPCSGDILRKYCFCFSVESMQHKLMLLRNKHMHFQSYEVLIQKGIIPKELGERISKRGLSVQDLLTEYKKNGVDGLERMLKDRRIRIMRTKIVEICDFFCNSNGESPIK